MPNRIFSMTKVTILYKEKKHWDSVAFNNDAIIEKEEELIYDVNYEKLKELFFDNIPEEFEQTWIDIDGDYDDKNVEFVTYAEYQNGYEYDKEIYVWFEILETNKSLIKAINDLQSMKSK